MVLPSNWGGKETVTFVVLRMEDPHTGTLVPLPEDKFDEEGVIRVPLEVEGEAYIASAILSRDPDDSTGPEGEQKINSIIRIYPDGKREVWRDTMLTEEEYNDAISSVTLKISQSSQNDF